MAIINNIILDIKDNNNELIYEPSNEIRCGFDEPAVFK